MSKIEFENVTKEYEGGVRAVKNFNLTIDDGEFVVFLGPSGCGKSTTLFMLAGIEKITEGEVRMNGVRMNEFPPKMRDVSVVFQNYALFPNLTVYENIGFGLTIRKVDKKIKDEKIRYAAKLLGLTEYLDRKPKQLSGGQKQRVAIGRCIVRDASVFLFDEPLSNLDMKLRIQMRSEILSLYHQLKTTMIYVTHDQSEAMALATKIVVMKDGVIQQVGTPNEIYHHPGNLFVATFVGSPKMNIWEAQVELGQQVTLKLKDGTKLTVEGERAEALRKGAVNGETIKVGVRPEDMEIVSGAEDNTVSGGVTLVELLGSEKNLYAASADGEQIIATTELENTPKQGETAFFRLNMNKAKFFNCETENAIG